MKYRLLLDIEVVEYLTSLKREDQLRLRRRLGEIQASPDRFSDYQENDGCGRMLDVHIIAGFAIYFWSDFADRHVKVLRVRRADI